MSSEGQHFRSVLMQFVSKATILQWCISNTSLECFHTIDVLEIINHGEGQETCGLKCLLNPFQAFSSYFIEKLSARMFRFFHYCVQLHACIRTERWREGEPCCGVYWFWWQMLQVLYMGLLIKWF